MLISIITPTYNSYATILSTYESIKNQDYDNWEWVVTDDCSTDQTVDILKKIAFKDSRVKVFVNDTNSGAAVSRNRCISESNGEFIAFLDSDDLWLPNKLMCQLEFMLEGKYSFSFTSYELIYENGNKIGKVVDKGEVVSVSYQDMLRKKATLGCSTVMLKKSCFRSLSMPNIRTGQDYALWLKLLKQDTNAYLLPVILTEYRIMPNSISRNKIKKAKRQWQIYREIEQLNIIDSTISFFHYAYRAVFRM
ncbi:glycosyltransferase family 2 protein [Vibrio sp. 10N.286.51.E5]|uniref:glycosyltransferase family 2 protein n=1 Tax=Vibrio sp. 10N.286.51.E5 TaxID=3229709 RepID=UPI00354D2DED